MYFLNLGVKGLTTAHLIIFAVDQCKFELEFCGVNSKHSGLAFPIQTINAASLNRRQKPNTISAGPMNMNHEK